MNIEAVSCLLQLGNIIRLQKNQILYEIGDKELRFFIVIYGWVVILEDDKYELGNYGVGAILGEEWLYHKLYSCREDSAVAQEETAVLEVTIK
mmetsp:Transcript_33835/g.24448  ORF Transcript_33835/g.24448 Transcript_33835/m.24448 type:complete len:93 (+) Transcript_33835:371-649(+)|eukprot:CAMPEP_0116872720 /NCGR_PEP_ID=MMETSP0463-20121206/3547_1 /TAXON_ID=181622 /ORGANISM="Strombidinopsis sp, Strain SopsisLIS2011" /LENGTH=92 /DNA_ID=CAMNT_0004513377 /DNA_START=353 /DNA_END=631 /DNA_ORIENTATION=+